MYIFGYSFFHKYCFQVTSDTLIPRPETEELCELILNQNPNKTLIGIDIGTGTGCIPITLLNERSNWKFKALDLSAIALKVAETNILNDSKTSKQSLPSIGSMGREEMMRRATLDAA